MTWEDHGPGKVFGSRILELRYPCLGQRESGTGVMVRKTVTIPGWYPSPSLKRQLLDDYRSALESRQFINHHDLALQECLSYRYTQQGTVEHPHEARTDDPTGARVNHGDRVIADALAWKMVKTFGMIGAVLRKPDESRLKVNTLGWRKHLAEMHDPDPWADNPGVQNWTPE